MFESADRVDSDEDDVDFAVVLEAATRSTLLDSIIFQQQPRATVAAVANDQGDLWVSEALPKLCMFSPYLLLTGSPLVV